MNDMWNPTTVRVYGLTNHQPEDKIRVECVKEAIVVQRNDLSLKHEIDVFSRKKDELRERYGDRKFIVIKGDEILGPFDNSGKAYEEGIVAFGLTPFLIELLAKERKVDHIPALALGLLRVG